ncbi:bifunctional isocitrate dehydrogenase kinase/phosphatase, partial [Paraburkholderia sp. SIMBA_055]
FLKHHADFFDPALWQKHKDHILRGELPDFYPYDGSLRFSVRYPERFAADQDHAANASTKPTVRAA